jgi:hypothetical protein
LLRIEGGNHSVVFYVKLLLRARRVFGFDNVIGGFPDDVDIAFFDEITLESIICAPDQLGTRLTLFDGENCGKGIVFNGYCFDGFVEKMAVRVGE